MYDGDRLQLPWLSPSVNDALSGSILKCSSSQIPLNGINSSIPNCSRLLVLGGFDLVSLKSSSLTEHRLKQIKKLLYGSPQDSRPKQGSVPWAHIPHLHGWVGADTCSHLCSSSVALLAELQLLGE